MAALKDIAKPQAAFDRKIVIYLEGKDDVIILKHHWFPDETNVDFRPAGDGNNAGGSKLVLEVVNQARQTNYNSAPTFGLADRDTLYFLAQREDLFFEADDDRFRSTCESDLPLGPYVRPLRRWEIESYLVAHARIVGEVLKDARFEAEPNESSMAAEMLEHANALIPIIAANMVLHARKKKALSDGFGVNERAREVVNAKIDEHFQKHLPNDASAHAEMNSNSTALEQFDDQSSPASRWERLSRVIDAKRLLSRLRHRHHVKELRGHLAAKVKDRGLVDPEFRDHIAHFQALARKDVTSRPT